MSNVEYVSHDEDTRCPARQGMFKCVYDDGHEGEHQYSDAAEPTRADPSVAATWNVGSEKPEPSLGVIVEKQSAGKVLLSRGDVEDLVERAFAGMGINDLTADDLVLLARVRGALS